MQTARDPSWREDFTVRSFEIDPYLRVTPQSICNFMQEAAGNQARALGCAVDQLIPRGLTWVISRIHLRMDRYPRWRERVTVATWPSAVQGRFALRDFILRDGEGKRVGAATSSWLVIDVEKRRPVVVPEIMQLLPQQEIRALPDDFPKLPEPLAEEFRQDYAVRLSDLDPNMHVNNARYVEWGLETVPTKFWRDMHLAGIEISFKAESLYGDDIVSISDRSESAGETVFRHSVRREEDGRELSRMRTVWTAPGPEVKR